MRLGGQRSAQLVAAVILATLGTVTASPLGKSQFTVTDGDTIHLTGAAKGTRLVGFNAPETQSPQCAAERALGVTAKNRLRELIAAAKTIDLNPVVCACAAGTQGTNRCNYGRDCAILSVDGEDVGTILMREQLAVSFVCVGARCPPTPKPWCQ